MPCSEQTVANSLPLTTKFDGGSCEKTLRDKLQKLQNRVAHVLTFSHYDADATELLEFLGWKNFACQQEIH